MLIATLNHNLPDLTDNLVNQLKKDPLFEKCELMVVDNGSNTESLAKSTTHKLEENTFFGGGFNIVLDYFLSTNHEYLYFLNNDLIFHGPSFLTTSLKEAKETMGYTEDVDLKTLEIAFDGNCNFACSYCNASFSTTWQKDIKVKFLMKNFYKKKMMIRDF